MQSNWRTYYGRNNVRYTDCGTYGGATYTVKFKAKRKNAKPHIFTVYKNANATDYFSIKIIVEQYASCGRYIYWID